MSLKRFVRLPSFTCYVLFCQAIFWQGFPTSFLHAQEPAGATVLVENIRVGLNGHTKVGRWAELTVSVEVKQPTTLELSVETLSPYGNEVVFPSQPQQFSEAGQFELHTHFKLGRLDSPIRLQLSAGENVVFEQRLIPGNSAEFSLVKKQSDFLYLTVGAPSGFEFTESSAEREINVFDVESPSLLPMNALGYEAVNAVIISGKYQMDQQRSEALRDWVQLGGHLVISVATETEQYKNSPLAEWVPVSVSGQSQLRELSGLEIFTGGNVRIPIRRSAQTAKFSFKSGKALAEGLNGPLLVRTAYGFGRVTFLGVDLNRAPLSEWKILNNFCRKVVLHPISEKNSNRSNNRRQLTHSGITELASQINASQEYFPDLKRSSIWSVMGMIMGYLLLIGPFDYLLVHRILKKPHLTWVTFPTMVLLVGTFGILGASSNGDQLQLNQLDILDIDGSSNLARTRSWMTVYSPETRRYQVSAKPLNVNWQPTQADQPIAPTSTAPRLSWNGIPEETFGGMYRSGGIDLGSPGYQLFPNAAGVKNLPINIWSTSNLQAEWNYKSPSFIQSQLKGNGLGRLSGTFSHNLPFALEDWIIAYGKRVYRPLAGRLKKQKPKLLPGVVWDPNGPNVYQRELQGFLTGTTASRVTGDQDDQSRIVIEQTDYDSLNPVPYNMIRTLTFYEIVGGRGYTGLGNASLDNLDLSGLLDLNRAVLFGKIEKPSGQVEIDGKLIEPDRLSSFIRIVIPVERDETVIRELPNFDK